MIHQSEDKIQAACYQWAYNSFPAIRGLIFSVPNGSTRHILEAQKLKATGLTAGIPDLLLLYKGVHAFEFKTLTGRVSPAQEKIHAIWKAAGHKVYIVRTEDEFKSIIQSIV